MQREIEVKVRVDNLQGVSAKLIELGCVMSEEVRQEDTIYINYDRPFDQFVDTDPFIRIRNTAGKHICTFKMGPELNYIEREFAFDKEDQLSDMLGFLGFKVAIQLTKVRSKTKYKDYEVCLYFRMQLRFLPIFFQVLLS